MEKISKPAVLPAIFQNAYKLKIHLAISFIVLCSVAAQIVIPAVPVPFTLQTLAVLLTGAVLGARKGFYTMISYLALGMAGLPVFAPVSTGMTSFLGLFGPTGGYLLAFPLGAMLTGFIVERNKSLPAVLAAFTLGEVVIIALGVMYLNTFFLHDLSNSIIVGASLFSVWTVAKIALGTGVTMTLNRLKK